MNNFSLLPSYLPFSPTNGLTTTGFSTSNPLSSVAGTPSFEELLLNSLMEASSNPASMGSPMTPNGDNTHSLVQLLTSELVNPMSMSNMGSGSGLSSNLFDQLSSSVAPTTELESVLSGMSNPSFNQTDSPASPEEMLMNKLSSVQNPLSSPLSATKKSNYHSIIQKAADTYHVDPNLIRSVIQHESSGNPLSTSPVGAQGLMQLMPQTAQELGVTQPYDPEQNIMGGTKYLKQLMDQFDGNKVLAVAAYNAGPASVQKYNGVPPYEETMNYVKNVLATAYA